MRKKILRFGGWAAAFGAIYGASSVCPFCGQQGCPVGAAGAGLVGAASAFLATGFGKMVSRKKNSGPIIEGVAEHTCECHGADCAANCRNRQDFP